MRFLWTIIVRLGNNNIGDEADGNKAMLEALKMRASSQQEILRRQ